MVLFFFTGRDRARKPVTDLFRGPPHTDDWPACPCQRPGTRGRLRHWFGVLPQLICGMTDHAVLARGRAARTSECHALARRPCLTGDSCQRIRLPRRPVPCRSEQDSGPAGLLLQVSSIVSEWTHWVARATCSSVSALLICRPGIPQGRPPGAGLHRLGLLGRDTTVPVRQGGAAGHLHGASGDRVLLVTGLLPPSAAPTVPRRGTNIRPPDAYQQPTRPPSRSQPIPGWPGDGER